MTKPLDLSYVMQHALLAGQMGILWENYDPTECDACRRLEALQARCDELEAERDLLRQQRDGFLKIVTKALRDVVDEGE